MSPVLRILVVDGDDDDRSLATGLLRAALPEAEIAEAPDPVAFAERIAEGGIDVAVVAADLRWSASAAVLGAIARRLPRCRTVALGEPPGAAVPAPRADASLPKSSGGYLRLADTVRGLAEHRADLEAAAFWERLRAAAPVGAFRLSVTGRLVQADERLARALGREPAGLGGVALDTLVTEPERVESMLGAARRGQPVAGVAVRLRPADGQPVPAVLALWPCTDAEGDGGFEGVVWLGLEAGPEAVGARPDVREVEELVCATSHDLQQPLQVIARYADLAGQRLAEAPGGAEARRFVTLIAEAADRMQSMIDGMLRRAAAGRTVPRPSLVPLDDAIDEACENLRASLEESEAEVRHAGLPAVTGDRAAIVALFQNLVGNALKFRGDDRPVVEVSCEERSDDWLVRVSDNGIGIAPEDADRVFAPFDRAPAAGDRPGTGMGLAICRRIAQAHGGYIWVQPRSGPGATGTTICVTLPRHLPPAGSPSGEKGGDER